MGFLKYNSVAKQLKKVTNAGSSSAWCEVFDKLSRFGPWGTISQIPLYFGMLQL